VKLRMSATDGHLAFDLLPEFDLRMSSIPSK
jgi:hypothetical protein